MDKNVKTGMYTRNGNDISFGFYTSLSVSDKARFVKGVSDAIVDDNYYSVLKKTMFDFYVVAIFTDVDLSEITESDNNIDAIEDFLSETNIVDIVEANADAGLIAELYDAVEKNIEYRTGIHVDPIASSLSDLLNTIEKKVGEIDLNSLMETANAMASISDELTPEKMLDAFAKTDVYKRNTDEIAKAKSADKPKAKTRTKAKSKTNLKVIDSEDDNKKEDSQPSE